MVSQYPAMNGTLIGSNIMNSFVYANSVTHGMFSLMVVVSFFLVVLLASAIFQIRFTSRLRFETSLLAASFSTLGFAVILAQVNGLINPVYFFVLVGITILSFVWVAMSSGE